MHVDEIRTISTNWLRPVNCYILTPYNLVVFSVVDIDQNIKPARDAADMRAPDTGIQPCHSS